MPGGGDAPNWDPAVWKDINVAVAAEVGRVRVAQKVFPTTVFTNAPTVVVNDAIKFPDFSIEEGQTKPFVEISQTFSLTATQVAKEPMLRTAKTLARMAAKAVALAEDKLLFQGKNAALGTVTVVGNDSLGAGLLGVANPSDASDGDAYKVSAPIDVRQRSARPPIWGENLLPAVAKGIGNLIGNKAQAPRYALMLPLDAYADTFVPVSNASLAAAAERIRPQVEGGFYGTGALPTMIPQTAAAGAPGKGLLVALGGDPTLIYVGREAEAEFIQKVGAKSIFRVVERVQFVARDPRAFVLLNLLPTP